MSEPTFTLELTKAEVVSLHRMANLWADVLLNALPGAEPPDGCPVLPLESLAMKAELALRLEGIEV